MIFETRIEDIKSLREKVKEHVLAVERILQEHYSSLTDFTLKWQREEIFEQLLKTEDILQKNAVSSSNSDIRATVTEEENLHNLLRFSWEEQKVHTLESISPELPVKWQKLSQSARHILDAAME